MDAAFCQELKEELHANDKQKQKDAVKKAASFFPGGLGIGGDGEAAR